MKYGLLLISFLLFHINSHAQNYFNQSIDVEGFSDLGKQVIDIDGKHLLISIGSLCEGDFSCITLVKTDWLGNVLWQKRYHTFPASYKTSTIILNKDKSFTAFGALVTREATGAHHDFYLTKFDSEGDSLWTKIFDYPYEDIIDDALIDDAGNYHILGYSNSLGKDQSDSTPFLMKTDSLGNILWQQTYGSDDISETVRTLHRDADGGFVIGGFRFLAENRQFESWAFKTDSLGQQIWEQSYGRSDDHRDTKVIPARGGGYWMSAVLEQELFEGQKWDFQQMIAKLDENGEIVDSLYFPANYEQRHAHLMELKNGDILLASVNRGDPDFPNPSNRSKACLRRISPNLEVLWKKIYSYHNGVPNDICYFIHGIETQEEDLIFTGLSVDSTLVTYIDAGVEYTRIQSNPNAWLVKLNKDGCFEDDCSDVLLLDVGEVAEEIAATALALEVYPNPSSQQVTFHFPKHINLLQPKLQIYTVNGQLLESIELAAGQTQHPLSTAHLPNGIYFCELVDGGRIVGQGKLVVLR